MNRYEIGMLGEDVVNDYLEKIGCYVIERNYRILEGEIDIIFVDKEQIVFGEVKTRRNFKYGFPCEAVDYRKQEKIIYVARQYLNKRNIEDVDLRFDVFEVYYIEKKIRHIKNAYEVK